MPKIAALDVGRITYKVFLGTIKGANHAVR